jgi:imidazolonepropionase-like amidohydrolase
VPVVVTGIEAAAAGQRSLEHLTGVPPVDDSAFAGTVAAFRRYGTWIDPTLSVYWVLAHRNDSAVVNDPRIALLTPTLREFWAFQKVGWSGDTSVASMRQAYRRRLAEVKALEAGGIPLLTGTDLGFIYIYPGSSVHQELEHLVEAGLTPLQALRAGTLNPARYFGWERDLGTVEVGKLADLVLVEANPLASIRNTRRIRLVVANGRVFDRAALDRLE